MNRRWVHSVALGVAVFALAGCSQTVEEQVSTGIENAQSTFVELPVETNTTIGHIDVYIPIGFTIKQGIDESNYTLLTGNDSYILFVNPNETEDSQLHYDILKRDTAIEFVDEKTFENDGTFGFSAVMKQTEEQYALIVSIGGVKLTTISNAKKIDDKLTEMMQVVKSVRMTD